MLSRRALHRLLPLRLALSLAQRQSLQPLRALRSLRRRPSTSSTGLNPFRGAESVVMNGRSDGRGLMTALHTQSFKQQQKMSADTKSPQTSTAGGGFTASVQTALAAAVRNTFVATSSTPAQFYDVCRSNGVERVHFDCLSGSATFYSRAGAAPTAGSGSGTEAVQSFRFAVAADATTKPDSVAPELDVAGLESALKQQITLKQAAACGVAHVITFLPTGGGGGSSGGGVRVLYAGRAGDSFTVDGSEVTTAALGPADTKLSDEAIKSGGVSDSVWSASAAGMKSVMHESLTDTLIGGFPKVVQTLMAARVESYWVDWTHQSEVLYSGGAGQAVSVSMNPHVPSVDTPTVLDVAALKATIKNSQNMQNPQTYQSFMKTAQAAGACGYVAFLRGRRVVYWGRTGQTHTEWFPGTAPAPAPASAAAKK